MENLNLLHDFRSEIRVSIDDIQAANDYETAVALWKEAYDNLAALHQEKIISESVFSTYAQLLDEAITE
ncbi:hypothetical protein [Faecalispora anaeroviscerum]|uniref:hypothetical protein n=1 Tax=Faecalispora anaeroviscerum TaxID=2991836 RepID=UPI0024BA2B06|nr:hypothetical protein [Faecalispora anaeroviscerum]